VRGAHVFVTETAVAQGFVGILVYPFVWAYYGLAGLTAIVLFVRHIHFLFSLAVALAVALSLREALETRRAALVAMTAVAFVPFNIHSLSYNTVGSGFFTAGCFLGFWCLREPEPGGASASSPGSVSGYPGSPTRRYWWRWPWPTRSALRCLEGRCGGRWSSTTRPAWRSLWSLWLPSWRRSVCTASAPTSARARRSSSGARAISTTSACIS